jgi:hypothetical protein
MAGWAGDREPQPYRRAPLLEMPVDSPEAPADPPPVTGRDGKPRSADYFRRSLGERPRAQVAPDDRVRDWTPVA